MLMGRGYHHVIRRKAILHSLTALLVFSSGWQTELAAQENAKEYWDMSLEELLEIKIEVSSSREEVIFNTPSTVSVIDREMINRYNFTSVSEALNLIAGFDVQRTYLKRNIPTSRGILQDHYANKVLVMVNNIPTWHAVTGEGNLDRIDINAVERIEVLKGPASVLYGTNAFTGAVNIVLKDRGENHGEERSGVRTGFGSHGMTTASANYFYAGDTFSIYASGHSSDETGYKYLFEDEQGQTGHVREYLRGSDFTLSATYKSHSFFLNNYTVHESYLGVTPRIASGAGNDHLVEGKLLSYEFSKGLNERIELNYGINYDWNRRDLSRTADDNTRADITGYRVTNHIKSAVAVTDGLRFEFGGDYNHMHSVNYENYDVSADTVIAENNMAQRTVNEFSLFGQADYTFGASRMHVGSRYTNNAFYGSNISSMASYLYSFTPKNSLKVIAGQSFRAPSPFEQYFRTPTNTVFGSTDLVPEKSNSFEIAYLTSFDRLFVQTLAYYSTYKNSIFRSVGDVSFPDTTYQDVNVYINGGEFSTWGLEWEMRYKNPKIVDAFLNHYFVENVNEDHTEGHAHSKLEHIPHHTISAGFVKSIGEVWFSGLVHYRSGTEGHESAIDAFTTMDLNIGYHHHLASHDLRHTLSVKNILDENVLIPEYVRRKGLNAVPLGFARSVSYTLQLNF